MNAFYDLPKFLQWIAALIILFLGFYPAILIVEAGANQPLYYLLFFVYLPIGQFITTPIFRLLGVYKYYSPMLLAYMENKRQIDLHNGSSFDYLFVLRKYKKGAEIRKKIIKYHLEGLLEIIDEIEKGSIPSSVSIVGTSYFFSERTLRKLGFETQKPSFFYRINLFMNCIDLFWMYSLSRGKLSIPQIWRAKKAHIPGAELIKSRQTIIELNQSLNNSSKVNN
jgi:hypothetical protein